MAIQVDDLFRGMRLAVPNQGKAITYLWDTAVIWYVSDTDVFWNSSLTPAWPWRHCPTDRFLDIVNAPVRGPHHTPRPADVDN